MPTHDLPLRPFGPRDETPQGTSRLGRALATLLVLAVISTTFWWASALMRNKAQANPWRSDPPTVSLTQRERDALSVVSDHPDALVVLNYHEVSGRAGTPAGGSYTVSPEAFSMQLATLKEAGYRSVRLAEVADFVAGRGTLPPRAVLITFDDGHSTDLGVADPILEQYGYNAVAFLITGSLAPGSAPSYYLSRSDVQTLRSTGRWEFGSHTDALHVRKDDGSGRQVTALDHRVRTDDGSLETFEQWHARVDADLAATQRALREMLGTPADAFAFPFNAYGQDDTEMGPGDPAVRTALAQLLRKHGFTLGFAGIPADIGSAVHGGDDPLTLRRLTMRGGMDAAQMIHVMDEVLPTSTAEATAAPWAAALGTCQQTAPGALRVEANSGAGASCRPRGNPDLWQDYALDVTVGPFGKAIQPVLTMRDGRAFSVADRIEVSLSQGKAEVREILNGRPRTLGAAEVPTMGTASLALKLRVSGTSVSVVANGMPIPTSALARKGSGGVSLGVSGGYVGPVTWRDVRIHD